MIKACRGWFFTALACTGFLTSCSGVDTGGPSEPLRQLPGPQLALDPDFGEEGELITDFAWNGDTADLALQSDGKLVAVVHIFREDIQSSDLALARFLPSGELDKGFGSNGYVLTPAGSEATAPNQGSFSEITLQVDGKILAAGYAALSAPKNGYTPGIVLARYNTDGSLDTSFGVEGLVRAEPGTGRVTAIELQPDGKIVVLRDGWSADETVLSRYTAAGQVDPDFGVEGVFTLLPRSTGLSFSEDSHLLQTLEGGFVLSLDTRLVKLNPAGLRDDTFGENGEVDTGYPIMALAQQENGSIVVGQYSEPDHGDSGKRTSPIAATDFRLMGYTSGGALNPGFGEAGVVITDITSGDVLSELALQSDGKIVAAGAAMTNQSVVAVVRYTPSGEVDASFVGSFGGAYALAIDDQNRIVVGGGRLEGDTYDFALARLLP